MGRDGIEARRRPMIPVFRNTEHTLTPAVTPTRSENSCSRRWTRVGIFGNCRGIELEIVYY
jgi:hypothetical protein